MLARRFCIEEPVAIWQEVLAAPSSFPLTCTTGCLRVSHLSVLANRDASVRTRQNSAKGHRPWVPMLTTREQETILSSAQRPAGSMTGKPLVLLLVFLLSSGVVARCRTLNFLPTIADNVIRGSCRNHAIFFPALAPRLNRKARQQVAWRRNSEVFEQPAPCRSINGDMGSFLSVRKYSTVV